jgi:cysteine desulfurase / selenocysteine lyase
VVLGSEGEFPANVYPWIAASKARGFTYERLPMAGKAVDEEALLARIAEDERVKCVALSWVSFWTGYRIDLARIGAACRARGILFAVDAIQGLGPLALDVATAQVDILSAGAQKWLCSPWGSGFVYVRGGLVPRSSRRLPAGSRRRAPGTSGVSSTTTPRGIRMPGGSRWGPSRIRTCWG